MINNRFKLEKSTHQGWWVLTDTDNLIVIRFEEHKYNDTQKVTILENSRFRGCAEDMAMEISHIMAEMGDYMYSHWYSIAMPTPVFEFRKDEDNDRMLIIRNKFPKITIDIQEDCDIKQLSDALKAASEFVKKTKQ